MVRKNNMGIVPPNQGYRIDENPYPQVILYANDTPVLEGRVEKTDRNGGVIYFPDDSDYDDWDDESESNSNEPRVEKQPSSTISNVMQSISNLNNELMNIGLGNNISYGLSEYLRQYPMQSYNNYPKRKYSNLTPQTAYYHKNMGYSLPKRPQERIDYINKPNTTTNYVKFNNTPPSPSEITMSFKKEKPVQSYQSREDILYPTMNEQSQIKYTAKKYPLLDNNIQKNYSNTYQEKQMPLMGDRDYVPPKLYEQDLLKKENELLKKQLEYERKINNRADILYPTMNDKNQIDNKNDVLLGGISKEVYQQPNKSSYSDFLLNVLSQPQVPQYNYTGNSLLNQIAVDHIDNKFLKWYASENYGLETAENLLMSKKDSYLNTDYAKEHLIFKNYKELSTDLRNYFEKKITKQIGADKLETTGGIYINAEHYSSKELAKVLVDNKEFVKKVAEARKSMEVGNSVNTSIQFTDRNFHYAIGKADILDMHINKNGEIDLLVTDVYDFNDDKNASDLIKTGRNRQEKGEIKPYFYIYHVIIPKSAKLGESGRR